MIADKVPEFDISLSVLLRNVDGNEMLFQVCDM